MGGTGAAREVFRLPFAAAPEEIRSPGSDP